MSSCSHVYLRSVHTCIDAPHIFSLFALNTMPVCQLSVCNLYNKDANSRACVIPSDILFCNLFFSPIFLLKDAYLRHSVPYVLCNVGVLSKRSCAYLIFFNNL